MLYMYHMNVRTRFVKSSSFELTTGENKCFKYCGDTVALPVRGLLSSSFELTADSWPAVSTTPGTLRMDFSWSF